VLVAADLLGRTELVAMLSMPWWDRAWSDVRAVLRGVKRWCRTDYWLWNALDALPLTGLDLLILEH
jgi:hypothetical protein